MARGGELDGVRVAGFQRSGLGPRRSLLGGGELGGRDHSTVLHACDKINRELSENDEMRREINAVREMIYSE